MTNTLTIFRIPSRCSSFFSYIKKKCKIKAPSTSLVKKCEPSTYIADFESRHMNLCGRVKDFETAWLLPWYHDGLPVAPLCASLVIKNLFLKLPLSFVHVRCRS